MSSTSALVGTRRYRFQGVSLLAAGMALLCLQPLSASDVYAEAAPRSEPFIKNKYLVDEGNPASCLRAKREGNELEMGNCTINDSFASWSAREQDGRILLVNGHKASDGTERCLINVGWQARTGACDTSRDESLWLLRDGSSGHVRLQNSYPTEERCLDYQGSKVVLATCTPTAARTALWSPAVLPRNPSYTQTMPERYPQPRNFTVSALPTDTSERNRLKQNMLWADWQPTGFYITPFTDLTINVSGSTASAKTELMVGTTSLVHPWKTEQNEPIPLRYALKEGANDVFSVRGGLIWVRHVTDSIDQKGPDIQVRLGAAAQPIPYFIANSTQQADWQFMLANSAIPYALLSSQHVLVVGSLQSARQANPDGQVLLDTYEQGIRRGQDAISGLDSVHPRNRPSPLRPMVVESRSGINPSASDYRAMLPFPDSGMFTPANVRSSWGIWHELGHLRQSPVWTWNWPSLGEVTVNVYTLAALRNNGWTSPEQPGPGHWDKALVHLAAPDADRDFDNRSKTENAVMLVMFEQLRNIDGLGDQFYHRLEQSVRAQADPGTEAGRKKLFQVEASKASGYDLTDYFKRWGLRPDADTLAAIAALNLPKPGRDLTTIPVFGGNNDDKLLDLWGFWLPSRDLLVDGHASPQGKHIQVLDRPGNLPLIATVDQHLQFVNKHLTAEYLEDGKHLLKAQIEGKPDTLKTFQVVEYPTVTELVAQRQANGKIRLSGQATPPGANIEVFAAGGSWPGVAHVGGDGKFENDHLEDHHMSDGRETFEVRMEYKGRSFKERFTTKLRE